MSPPTVPSQQGPALSPPRTRRPFKRIDYLYKEYVRQSQRLDTYIQGSFSDFKMLAALGSAMSLGISVAALYFHEGKMLVADEERTRVQMAFVGFLSSLAIVAILAFRDLLKQSLITGLTEHLCQYEKVLQEQLELTGTNTFAMSLRADDWMRSQHIPLSALFHFVFVLSIGGIPTLVLSFVQPRESAYALAYACICVSVFLLHLGSAAFLRRFRIPPTHPK